MRARAAWLAAEPFKPVGGQRGAAIGSRAHTILEWHLGHAVERDAQLEYGPRRQLEWESLPGQLAHALLQHLPNREALGPDAVEGEQSVTVDGVPFRSIADILHAGVWDHKTSRDIRAYALLPHDVAVELGVPERSLRDDLQACINALAYAVGDNAHSDASASELADVPCHWTYVQTEGKERRTLPVVQNIPVSHALTVVRSAAALARTLTYESSDEAPGDTLRCDDYGGCWYRREGHCTKPRRWGGVFRQAELKEQKDMTSAIPPWKKLQSKVEDSNAKQAAPAAPAKPVAVKPAPAKVAAKPPVRPKPAPAPEPVEEVEETVFEDGDVSPNESTPAELPASTLTLDLQALSKTLADGAAALTTALKAQTAAMKAVREAIEASEG
jgi:hypothetical protein